MPAKVKFYGFPGSNSVYTGRLMLEHKGIDYKRRDAHARPARVHHARPRLRDDGRAGAEDRRPPRPGHARDLARARRARPRASRCFPPTPRGARPSRTPSAGARSCRTRRGGSSTAPRAATAGASRASWRPGARCRCASRCGSRRRSSSGSPTGAHRASDAAGREDLELLPERLDQIDAWIAEGLLGGDELNAADFQIARQRLRAHARPTDLAPFIEGRPAAALARRVAPDYAGHLGRDLAARMAGAAARRRRREGCRRRPRRRTDGRRRAGSLTRRGDRGEADARRARARRRAASCSTPRSGASSATATTARRSTTSPTRPATRRAPSTRRSRARAGCSSRCSTRSSTAASRSCASCSSPHDGDEAKLAALAAQPVDERNAQFLLLAIEFWVHAAREPGAARRVLRALPAPAREARRARARSAARSTTSAGRS